ncbi:HAMP domain-containing sensor histidine kinase [Paenibacillus agaridevorans]|uniref:HAMP domain-containing sensor histidine kinase n=1 Tax=Paenibacillus agaridevorans TaxID=171404 RepID=UPI001BE4A967|nr:HAMP domain-containing sensor histidine kinase [Paenibacillus agaridevorans]
MNRIARRLTYTFIAQIAFIMAVLIVGTAVFLVYVGMQMEGETAARYATSESRSELRYSFSIDNSKVRLAPQWLSGMEERGEWIQVLDSGGGVLASSATPPDVPDRYAPGELVSFWQKDLAFPYDVTISREEKNGQSYVVVVGKKNAAKALFQLLRGEWDGEKLLAKGEQLLRQQSGGLQIYNAEGRLTRTYGEGKAAKPTMSLEDLLGNKADARRGRGREFIHYDPSAKQTWIVQADVGSAIDDVKAAYPMGRLISLYGAGILLFVLLAAIWYAGRLGRPFRYIIVFIQKLAAGDYTELHDAKGRSYIMDRRGKLKRSFRVFREVVDSLNGLMKQLRQNEHLRAQSERTREEWIVGISHDLKTPLSSIKGYAHLFESAHYPWSEEELRMIGKTLREKSGFISELIDDLNLTYRLKNDALPLERKRLEVNEVVRRTVVHFINDPQNEAYEITFRPSHRPILFSLDPKWFTRIIDNMISNALKHNPPDIRIDITVGEEADHWFSIAIKDNGIGMDQATLDNLFDRYFRGTNSEEKTIGSGLGMSIAKQLTLAHGGEITVSSTQEIGTEIVLRFNTGLRFQ